MNDSIKEDYPFNSWVASTICNYLPVIIAAEAREHEDYSVADIDMSAATLSYPGYKYYPLEVKRIMGGYNFKEDGEWRSFFTSEYYGWLQFENTGITTGAPIWIINAADICGNEENAKLYKLKRDNACLAFVAGDGIVLFSPKSLRKAIIGYAKRYCNHTELYDKKGKKSLERKAVVDLSKGLFIPCTPPRDQLMKN